MYQADEHQTNLDDISVGHRVQPSHQSVDNCHSSRRPNGDIRRDVHHHANRQSYTKIRPLVPLLASSSWYCHKAVVQKAMQFNMRSFHIS